MWGDQIEKEVYGRQTHGWRWQETFNQKNRREIIRDKSSKIKALHFWGNILEMEVYKLEKIIKNQEIEIQLILHQLNEARDDLKKIIEEKKGNFYWGEWHRITREGDY